MDKSYAESLAGDLYHAIQAAQEAGLDMKNGFRNTPLNGPNVFLHYMFYSKQQLLRSGPMPEHLKRKLKKANILATIDLGTQKIGIFFLCSLNKEFSEVESEQDVARGMDLQGVEDFATRLRQTMKAELQSQASAGNKTEI